MIFKNRAILMGVIAVLLIGSYFFLFGGSNSGTGVQTVSATVDRGDIVSTVTANGTLKPNLELEVYPEINGIIENVYVDINDNVNKGDVLASVDPSQFEIRFKEATAKYNKASAELKLDRDTYNSDRILYSKELISKQEYENSKARFKNAQALYQEASTNIESAKEDLNKTKIKSSIDGQVLSKKVNIGQFVSDSPDNGPIFTVADDLRKMNLIIHVSEADIGKTTEEQLVDFKVSAYPNERFSGRITKISNSPNIDKDIVTYDVTAEIDNSDLKLKPGMTAEVNVVIADKNDVLRVPTSALRFVPSGVAGSTNRLNGDLSVWVEESKGKFKEIPLEIGASNNEYTEVLGNSLSEGQKIVIESYTNEKGSKSILTLPQPKRF